MEESVPSSSFGRERRPVEDPRNDRVRTEYIARRESESESALRDSPRPERRVARDDARGARRALRARAKSGAVFPISKRRIKRRPTRERKRSEHIGNLGYIKRICSALLQYAAFRSVDAHFPGNIREASALDAISFSSLQRVIKGHLSKSAFNSQIRSD